MRIIILLLFLFTIFGCKEKKQAETIISEPIMKIVDTKPSELKIKISIKSTKNDILKFVLYEINLGNLKTKRIEIEQEVSVSEDFRNYNFEFGLNNISRKLEIGLGDKNEKELEIGLIDVTYEKKTIKIYSKDINKYFALSKYCKLDDKTRIIKTTTTEGYHFPKLYAKSKFWDDLGVEN